MKGQRAEDVVRQGPAFLKQPWVKVKLSRQTVGTQVWEVKAAQVWQMQDKEWSNRTYWLIWARNVATGEEKYFLSNAPANAKLQTLVRVDGRIKAVKDGRWLRTRQEWVGEYMARKTVQPPQAVPGVPTVPRPPKRRSQGTVTVGGIGLEFLQERAK